MTGLPQYLRRLPYVLYVMAFALGVWRTFNEWAVVSEANKYAEVVGGASINSISMSNALYSGVADTVYYCALAALLQVAIAIFDKVEGPPS